MIVSINRFSRWSGLLLCCLSLLIAACAAPAGIAPEAASNTPTLEDARPSRTPTEETTDQPTSTPEPSATASTPTADIPPATLEAELAATAAAQLPPTTTPDPQGAAFGGFDGVGVMSLDTGPDDQPLWAVYSLGFRSVEQNHFVTVYTRDAQGWQQLDRVELEFADILAEEGVKQVEIEPEYTWIEVQSGAGAHSGGYDLFRFDGTTLHHEASGFHASPVAGWLEDLNDDGLLEVVLNQSDPYIFCYACNVVEIDYHVLRWDEDDTRMVEVELTPLPVSAPDELRRVMNEAVELAGAGLWQEAALLAQQASDLNDSVQDTTTAWNIVLIELIAEEREEHARTGEYPLLGHLFYGDYTAVMGILSGYSAEELFQLPNPLIVGTTAEGFEQGLITTITAYTTRTLEVRPELAEAYFLRGWARYLANPEAPEALADVQQAAELAPDQPLIIASLEHLRSDETDDEQADLGGNQAVIAAAQAYMQNRTGEARDFVVTVDKQEGDYARVTITDDTGTQEPVIAFLKFENGTWGVITEVNDPELDIDTYRRLGIPESMLSDLLEAMQPDAYEEIAATVNQYVSADNAITSFLIEVWGIEGDYARTRAIPVDSNNTIDESTDPLVVYLIREGGQWRVLTIGTTFDTAELEQEGVPTRLINLDTDIRAATRAFVQENAIMPEPYYVEIEGADQEFARTMIESADVNIEPLYVFLEREQNTWNVLDYGTDFSADFFDEHGIPQSLQTL